MGGLRDAIERLRVLVFRQREDAELDEELQFHLQMEAEQRERGGVSPAEARRLSALALGGIEQTKDHVRDARGTRWLEDFSTDIALAIRAVRRSPGFSAIAIGMLAIGIGANTAIFTLVNAVVVSGLPVPRAHELVMIGNPSMANSSGVSSLPRADSLSYPLYRDIREHGGPLSGLLASGRAGRLDVRVEAAAVELEHPHGRFVSGNYFSVLEIPAWRGRVFDASEDRAIGGAPVAVISHDYWSRRFQQEPSVIGRAIHVNHVPLTIIGVGPPGFSGEVVGESADLWLPITMHDALRPQRSVLDRRNAIWLLGLGRLAPGATLAQARADLAPFIIRTLADNASDGRGPEFLDSNPQVPIAMGRTGFSSVRDDFQTPLVTLMAGVGLLLCIVCANVANLLLARAVARGKEMAVRVALGAGRGRLARLLLTESLVLALLGGAGGVLLAWWGSSALLMFAADGNPIALDLSLDVPILMFTLAVSFTAVALFGLAPALRASRTEPVAALRANARTVVAGGFGAREGNTPLGGILIAGQVALSIILLVGAAMLTRSLRNVESVEVGLDRDHLLMLEVDIAAAQYTGDRVATLARMLRDRLAAIPGVVAVGYSENGIFSGTDWSAGIEIPGRPLDREASRIGTDNVGPGYIGSLGGRLIAGREFDEGDQSHPIRAAVVNQALAAFYFPNENAVGKSFTVDKRSLEIVGVVADVRDRYLAAPPRRRAYYPYMPTDDFNTPGDLRFAIRTVGDPSLKITVVRSIVAGVDPALPIARIAALQTLMRQSIREERLVAMLATAFGVLALLLASVGLYGVMTYAVRRRTGEIGLRVALGAQRVSILRLVVSQAMRLVVVGMVVGVPLALALTQWLGAQLYDVPAIDPISISIALAVLAISASVAALLPAVSASRVEPLVALGTE